MCIRDSNTYADGTGGNQNLVMFNKSTIGMRIYQSAFGSATPYATYKDVLFQGDNISAGTVTATGAISASNFSGSSSGTNTGDVTLTGQNYITISGQTLTVGQINLGGTHVTGTLGTTNGGTGATTAQGAINNLSGLTTNGDILYHNGTNTTRLARGTNGQCLTSNATTLQWASCGLSAEADTLATVTGRGATTTTASSFQGGATIRGLTIDNATATNDLITCLLYTSPSPRD